MDEQEFENQISPELNAKMKKNLLYGFIFAVCMIFAGLTSGYIVSQGGNFWVNIKMPSAFMISTISIIISSLFLIIAHVSVKKNKQGLVKLSLGLAFGFGLTFGISQYIGWKQLIETGNTVNAGIINSRGKYGKYYTLIYQGKEISYDNATFFIKGEPISEALTSEMKAFAQALMDGSKSDDKTYSITDYGTNFSVRADNKLLTYTDGKLLAEGVNLSALQSERLWYFAENIVNDRGDFIMKGLYGEDFVIYYSGEELVYKNRTFYFQNAPLSPKKLDALNSQKNTASSYIYAFTGVHLLHWLGGIIALLVMFISALRLKYNSDNRLGITLGSIYWHFLGILWLYLYAFLIFIH